MSSRLLKLLVRTPQAVVLEVDASSLRVPTETGQVGVRPRIEPLVLAVEPGLVLVRHGHAVTFVGTAGGLLRCNGKEATLLTPLAVVGDDEEGVLEALEEALARPSAELEARATISRLQTSILRELREGEGKPLRGVGGER
jgi:F0F1-type ATP synthase epsilon subunit